MRCCPCLCVRPSPSLPLCGRWLDVLWKAVQCSCIAHCRDCPSRGSRGRERSLNMGCPPAAACSRLVSSPLALTLRRSFSPSLAGLVVSRLLHNTHSFHHPPAMKSLSLAAAAVLASTAAHASLHDHRHERSLAVHRRAATNRRAKRQSPTSPWPCVRRGARGAAARARRVRSSDRGRLECLARMGRALTVLLSLCVLCVCV